MTSPTDPSGVPAESIDPGSGGVDPPPGPHLARAALTAARLASRARSGATQARWRRVGTRSAGWTGSGPDAADPQPFGRLVARLVADRGWEKQTAEATVMGRWGHLVGADIAAHSQPVSLRDGDLVVSAESTAWATQLRLLAPRILTRLQSTLGADVVTSLRVHGPSGPSWKSGRRSVPGRGPRDTYG